MYHTPPKVPLSDDSSSHQDNQDCGVSVLEKCDQNSAGHHAKKIAYECLFEREHRLRLIVAGHALLKIGQEFATLYAERERREREYTNKAQGANTEQEGGTEC